MNEGVSNFLCPGWLIIHTFHILSYLKYIFFKSAFQLVLFMQTVPLKPWTEPSPFLSKKATVPS